MVRIILECVQETMGGEEVETARKDKLNSRESWCQGEHRNGVLGSWEYWVKKVVIFLKRGNITVCLDTDGDALLSGRGVGDAGTGGDICSSKVLLRGINGKFYLPLTPDPPFVS